MSSTFPCRFCQHPNRPTARFCASCRMPLLPLKDREGNDRYQVTRSVAVGGMGAVYEAEDLQIARRIVAVKEDRSRENPDFRSDADNYAAHFMREAARLNQLEHSNLPKVLDYFVDYGRQYLVMDYIPGQNLEKIVETTGPVAEQKALEWMKQILWAVEYLHKNGIIHRDIHPKNIIIRGTDGKAILVDLGIAKEVQMEQAPTPGAPGAGTSGHAPSMPQPTSPQARTGGTLRAGRPGFAPLEQYKGGTDERSDVYSLGATLYFALTAEEPPEATQRKAGTLTAVRRRKPNVSQRIAQAIDKAMDLDPAKRYHNAAELREALKLPPEETPQIVVPSTQPSGKRRTPWLEVSFGGVVMLLALAILWIVVSQLGNLSGASSVTATTTATFMPSQTATRTLTPTPTNTALPTMTPTLLPPPPVIGPGNAARLQELAVFTDHDQQVGAVRFSPDGKLLWSSEIAANKQAKSMLLAHDSAGKVVERIELRGAVNSISFFQDLLAVDTSVEADDGRLTLFRSTDGHWAPYRTWKAHEDAVNAVAFSADGTMLASGSSGSIDNLKLWKISDGTLVRTLAGHTQSVRSIAFSPDQKTLASGADDQTVILWRTDGTLWRTLRDHGDVVESVAFSPNGEMLASGSADRIVRLWGVLDESLRPLTGPSDRIWSVAFSPSGEIVAAASGDMKVRLWNVSNGMLLKTLEGHTGSVTDVTFSPDGTRIATASSDETIRLWGMKF